MKKFGDIVDENSLLLLRYYEDSQKEIKNQIFSAVLRGDNIAYLKTVRKNIEIEINRLRAKFQYYSTTQQKDTYIKGAKEQEKDYKQLGIRFEPLSVSTSFGFGGLHKSAIESLAINTYKPLDKVANIIGRDCIEFLERTNFKETQSILKSLLTFIPDSEELRKIGVANIRGVVTGNTTWQQAIKGIRQDFAKQEIFKVPYYTKSGDVSRLVNMRDYAELVARTTSAEAYRQGSKNSILETFDGNDLVQINGISDNPNSPCVPFQEAILSLSGKTQGYTTIDEAEAQGLFHPNCIHHFAVTLDVIDEYEKRNIDY